MQACDHTILEIADTFMSRLLDEARRQQWARMGEPARPEHPPERYLTDHGDHRTEGLEHTVGGGPLSHDEQREAFAAQHSQDAEEQIRWEAASRAQADEWRARQSTADKTNDGD